MIFFLFYLEIGGKGGWNIVGGGGRAKGYVGPPPSQIIGGGGGPGPPSSYAYVVCEFIFLFMQGHLI